MSRPKVACALATTAVLVTSVVGCGRSSPTPTNGGASAKPTAATGSSPVINSGDFGSAKRVCAPGPGTGGTGRGVTTGQIRIGTLADAGAAADPGLGQEFFDTADAFAKWCNAAGGIHGRKIVIDKLDAKLFNGAAQIINACQRDFMLVGGGNALDAADVKPRIACKLGQIPAYSVSAEATGAGLQVSPNASVPTIASVGALRLLGIAHPEAKLGFGIGSSSLASIASQGLASQEAAKKLGYNVSTLQARPALVDNYRPWIEQMKQSGARSDYEIIGQDPTPVFAAMRNTGFKPAFVLFPPSSYSPKSVDAARASRDIPPSYVFLPAVPFELSEQFPAVQQAKSIMAANNTVANDFFHQAAFDSWVLWAQAATACGNQLTQECVLENAGSHKDWDAGGLYGPTDVDPKDAKPTACVLVMRLTSSGFVYDKGVTQPDTGLFNCDPRNLVAVKNYSGSS